MSASTKPHAPTSTVQRPSSDRAAELESRLASILSALEANQGAMLRCCEAQRGAMRRADIAGVRRATDEHARLVREAVQIDAARAQLVKEFSPASAGTNPRGAAALRDLAQRLEGEARDRLLAATDRVRGVMIEAQRARVALRVSAATLSDHMEGLARQVARKLSHAGTYSPKGVVESRQMVVSGLDLKS